MEHLDKGEIADDVLIAELKRRFDEKTKALHDLRVLTEKLASVNKKLQDSEQLKTNFLSNIRNEINNPLSSILGLSRQIVDGDIDAASVVPISSLIYKEAFDLDFQLRNIFMAAELEAGDTMPSASRVDMELFTRNIVASFAHKAVEKDLKVTYHCQCSDESGRNLFFVIDAEKLHAVLSNLLANAIEFSPVGATVSIDVKESNKEMTITIVDRGPGIPVAMQKHIYDRFVQLDSGIRKSHRGHGLGLSIVKALVEMLNGSIRLESAADKGTVFIVILPESEGAFDSGVFSEEGNEFIFENDEKF